MNKNLYRLSQLSAITLTGENAQTFLQGQLTCDVNALKLPGDCSLGACCDHKGRMLANFWLLKRANDYLIVLPKDLQETIISHLHKYAMFSKVAVAASENICICAANNVETDTLKKSQSDNQIIICLPNPKRHLIISENKLCETAQKDGDTAWEKENINDNLALLSSKTSLLFTPQMINLEKLGGVSFTKGCYVGQEIVARTQHLGKLKRHLQRIQIENEKALQPGDPLLNENGEKVGTIVNAVFNDGNVDALAVIEDRALNQGLPVN